MTATIRHSLPEGLWRIVALGGITHDGQHNTDPIQSLYVRAISKGRASLERCELPLGETFDLFPGALLNDGVLKPEQASDLRRFRLKISISASGMTIVRRGDRDSLDGSHVIPWRDDLAETADLYMAVLRGSADRSQVVIPCAELFRFYYLTSSRLGRVILSPNMLDPNRTLFSDSGSCPPDAAGHMKLVLRRGVLASDAPIVARWIASPNRYGLHAAKEIARHQIMQVASKGKNPVPLRVLPPFEGPCTWTALGHQIQRSDRTYIFVCKLISCDASLGYRSLEWRYEDDRPESSENPGHGGGGDAQGNARTKLFVDDEPLDFMYLDEGNKPTAQFNTRLIPLDDLRIRFPALNVDGVKRVIPDASRTHPAGTRAAAVPRTASSFSARAPGSEAEIGTQAVEFTSTHPKLTVPESSDRRSEGSLSPRQALQLVFDICDEIASRRIACRERLASERTAIWCGRPFNMLPPTNFRPRRRFLFMDEARMEPRPVYVAEFESSARFGYLLEIPRKPGERYSTLLFRDVQHARVPDPIIAEILAAVADKESANIPDETMNCWGLLGRRALHMAESDIPQRANDFMSYLCLASVDAKASE